MKKKNIFFLVMGCSIFTGCISHHSGHTNITFTESKHSFSMEADFNESKTRAVEVYMDDQIGQESNTSFINTTIDGQVGLDDGTKFYMEKSPGHLEIQMKKEANSSASYRKIKSMCQGMKDVIQDKAN